MKNTSEKWKQSYLRMAKEAATHSKCVAHQVGAILVKEGRIISTGINGTPIGYENCVEVMEKRDDGKFYHADTSVIHREWSRQHEIHAEMNALSFAARNGISTEGATLYCTHQPCNDCMKNLIQAGVIAIYFSENFSKTVIDTQMIDKYFTGGYALVIDEEANPTTYAVGCKRK